MDRCWETFDALIKAGASVHPRGGLFGTALQAAAYVGDERYVKTLLLAGADVQTRGGFYGSCLQAIAAGEADEWWTGMRGVSFASEGSVVFPEEARPEPDNHANTMEKVLTAGARGCVNEGGGFFGTCLQAAAHSDNPTLVKMLLNAGATVTEDGRGFYGGLYLQLSDSANRD